MDWQWCKRSMWSPESLASFLRQPRQCSDEPAAKYGDDGFCDINTLPLGTVLRPVEILLWLTLQISMMSLAVISPGADVKLYQNNNLVKAESLFCGIFLYAGFAEIPPVLSFLGLCRDVSVELVINHLQHWQMEVPAWNCTSGWSCQPASLLAVPKHGSQWSHEAIFRLQAGSFAVITLYWVCVSRRGRGEIKEYELQQARTHSLPNAQSDSGKLANTISPLYVRSMQLLLTPPGLIHLWIFPTPCQLLSGRGLKIQKETVGQGVGASLAQIQNYSSFCSDILLGLSLSRPPQSSERPRDLTAAKHQASTKDFILWRFSLLFHWDLYSLPFPCLLLILCTFLIQEGSYHQI